MMKKALVILAALCLMMISVTALAAGPTVSFTKTSATATGGFDYELAIKISKAPAEDLTVTVVNKTTGDSYEIVIPAGSTTASITIPTIKVDSQQKMVFAIQKSDAYTAGSNMTLSLNKLPNVQFYLAMYHAYVGEKMNVIVLCKNPAVVSKTNNVFTLKDHDGTVLAEKEWSNPSNRLTFQFDATEELYGRHDFTVWLGDYCVTADDGYGVITSKEDRPVVELSPELPLMGIGIDCGFEGRKTYDILEVLEKHGVKCTFFMTGYFLREFPEEAKAIYEAGHEIASHSNTHKHLKTLSTHNIYQQITIPMEEAEELLGVTPRLFRPPYGEYNKYITGVSLGEGMEVVMWGPTYHDSTGKYSKAQIMKCATTGFDYKPGSIVLCHCNGYYQPESLETGLTYYESLGLHVVPISALIYASGGELPQMPHNREALVYTNEYWETWIEREMPHLLELGAE